MGSNSTWSAPLIVTLAAQLARTMKRAARGGPPKTKVDEWPETESYKKKRNFPPPSPLLLLAIFLSFYPLNFYLQGVSRWVDAIFMSSCFPSPPCSAERKESEPALRYFKLNGCQCLLQSNIPTPLSTSNRSSLQLEVRNTRLCCSYKSHLKTKS